MKALRKDLKTLNPFTYKAIPEIPNFIKTLSPKQPVSTKKAERYYKNKRNVNKVIRQHAKTHNVTVYGNRAINSHLPRYLDKHTDDWDFFSSTPRRHAHQVERRLDKRFGGDYFRVEPAQHPGTFKVRNNITNEGVADYTKPNQRIPSTRKEGMKVAKLSWIKKQKKETLLNPSSQFRHAKDEETLTRIRVYEKQQV